MGNENGRKRRIQYKKDEKTGNCTWKKMESERKWETTENGNWRKI